MEDIIKALLDVVRVQHAATEGTDETPFNMDDVVDMAMNLVGRPEEPEEVTKMVESIQSMVETLAPDLFPPKTFEQMDDEERALSAGNMIEARLKRGRSGSKGRTSRVNQEDDSMKTEVEDINMTDVSVVDIDEVVSDEAASNYSDSRQLNSAISKNRTVYKIPQPDDGSHCDIIPPAGRSRYGNSQMNNGSQSDISRMDGSPADDFQMDSSRSFSARNDSSQESEPSQEGNIGVSQDVVAKAVAEASVENGFNAQETAQLNDLIYKSLAGIMGVQDPQVEYPFDRSQIRYGREKTITEMLEEEQAENNQNNQEKNQQMDGQALNQEPEENPPGKANVQQSAMELAQNAINRDGTSSGANSGQLTAWELAQDVIDKDVAAHEKEPYIPPVEKTPETKSASQLAAEAIRKAQEQDREKMEIEKQAERLMEEARKRGQDPMRFALHQQEILQYMEKNSDELVSFEDYEDLSPEEKYEIERQIYVEKQIADGVDPAEVDQQVPEEYIPEELKYKSASTDEVFAGSPVDGDQANGTDRKMASPVLTEEMLRQLSEEVLRENSDMILAENEDEDMESLNDLIFENIKQMMSGSGTRVRQEEVDDLLEQAAQAAKTSQSDTKVSDEPRKENEPDKYQPAKNKPAKDQQESNQQEKNHPQTLSAVELARTAQKVTRSEPKQEVKKESLLLRWRRKRNRQLLRKRSQKPRMRKRLQRE
ncbi:MAG: hypothetical protein LUF92_16300, partial [Clostridiales bacterium]|nr:hypothetical protein [Clostridiales bacterium]